MAKVQVKKVRQGINKAYLKVKPERSHIDLFKKNLIQLLDRTNDIESEEFHKNLIADFLKETYYSPNHFINTKGRNDLVIHNDKKPESSVGVIVETKKPTNTNEMLSKGNINVKAFHELILYFLRERITLKNLEIKYLVATNIYEWFIFDASFFEKAFAQNKKLVKQFEDFEAGRLSGTTTDSFYNDIAKPFVADLKEVTECTYFDLKTYEKPLRNDDKKDDAKLIALFKLFSPEHLLKLPFANDSNSLDYKFYKELLHLIGLEETKEGSKKVIKRAKKENRNSGSLLENTITQLDTMDKLSRIENPSQYGANREERLFNVGLELCITWVNRILFLKLLEAQLVTYHGGDSSFAFLNLKRIKDYDELNTLFFMVLARKFEDRSEEINKVFGNVPYLNSSLFEPTDLEQDMVVISNLRDNRTLPVLSSTVLKNESGKKRTGELNALEYLFAFLDAYDFSSEGSEDIQEDNKTLINASVLGLIFEKINGYKDGSFFTPGFITMYMCRETIRRAVVQKFNEAKSWDCETLDDLYEKIEDRTEANDIINSLKICDPAVGSGHFLVSALNEILAIKNDLNLLQDRNGRRLKEYELEVVNDELIITDEEGELFEYHLASKESQRVQETLFHEKQMIIENCLFGVDINPNSVKICRLRLWIELLKSAYYKSQKENEVVATNKKSPLERGFSQRDAFGKGVSNELETLPNIDINIKTGNSLISRFGLDADIKEALKRSKWSIDSYRVAVDTYRNAENKAQKKEMERMIEDIKSDFRTEIASNDPKVVKLKKLSDELVKHTTQTSMFEQTAKEKKEWKKKSEKLTQQIKKLETEIEEIKSNKIYENAFEWRFEFPEVLNKQGDFVGFDVVIGNPPYIRQENIDKTYKKYYVEYFTDVGSGTADVYVYFFGRSIQILKEKGEIGFITLNKWLKTKYGENLRIKLSKLNVLMIVDFFELPVFDEASTDSAISFIRISEEKSETKYVGVKSLKNINLDDLSWKSKAVVKKEKEEWKFIEERFLTITEKIEAPDFTLGEFVNDKIYLGVKTGLNRAFIISNEIKESLIGNGSNHKIIKPYLSPTLFDSSKYNWDEKWIIMSHNGVKDAEIEPINIKNDYKNIYTYLKSFEPEIIKRGDQGNHWTNLRDCAYLEEFYTDKIIYVYTAKDHHFYYDKDGFIVNNSCFFISSQSKFLWAFLNSSLFRFYQKIKFVAYGDADTSGRVKLDRNKMLSVPFKKIKPELETFFSKYFMKIFSLKKENPEADTSKLEAEIDQMVYELYGLTEEEIAIVEESVG